LERCAMSRRKRVLLWFVLSVGEGAPALKTKQTYQRWLSLSIPAKKAAVACPAFLGPSPGVAAHGIVPALAQFPPAVRPDALRVLIRSERWGNADSGNNWPDSARAFPEGQDDQRDRSGPQGVPKHGPQGAAIGGAFGYQFSPSIESDENSCSITRVI
jgi:hypothetical protein